MNHIKPTGAPPCWGKTYQDGDPECRQCHYNSDCKQEMFYQLSRPNPSTTVRYAPPLPVRPILPPASTTVMPLPARPYFAPPASSIPVPPRPIAPQVTVTHQNPPVHQAPQAQSTYYQASTGFSLPNPTVQNPMSPWHRPGAPAPSYYFVQHPGEGTGTRLAKNAILRALEAIFAELMQFFRHWTWPPGSKK